MVNTLAVDGDIVAHRCSVSAESESIACEYVEDKLSDIATYTGVNKMRIYLSGDNNFRYKVAVTKPYKGNRSGEKPEYLNAVKNLLTAKYSAITVHGYEADDAIASDMSINGAIHCGQDKDIYQIAGKHYNFVTQEWEEVSEEQAVLNLYRQILMGDSTDNIQGLPNVGEKTAAKIIHDAKTAPQDARDYYKEVCAKKMPDIDVKDYWKEQVLLIQLVSNLNILDIMTAYVKGAFLKI